MRVAAGASWVQVHRVRELGLQRLELGRQKQHVASGVHADRPHHFAEAFFVSVRVREVAARSRVERRFDQPNMGASSLYPLDDVDQSLPLRLVDLEAGEPLRQEIPARNQRLTEPRQGNGSRTARPYGLPLTSSAR